MRLQGRRGIVTGASRGLGLAVARAFVQEGAELVICARGAEALAAAREEMLGLRRSATVHAVRADVARPDDVQALVDTAHRELGGVDVLLCSAGIYGPKGAAEAVAWDAWRQVIEVNLMGTVLACRAVLPHMKAQKRGKILLVAGGGAIKPMPRLSGYSASKVAVARFGETLALEVEPWSVDVNIVAPGAINTGLLDEILAAGPGQVGQDFYDRAVQQKLEGGTPISRAVALCVFLASAESDGLTGRLLSAVWDPWDRVPSLKEKLQDTDIYTLRRIVPPDRGQSW